MNLLDKLIELLKQEEKFVANNKLLKNKIIESALKIDPLLIKLLLSDSVFKQHFFIEIEDITIFDKDKFMKFVSNKQFLPDSYTAFKNKIGLAVGEDQYFYENREVVINFPYKDCILVGGQDKEDTKRSEIFYNYTLAPEQVDMLIEQKVFTNVKKYSENGIEDVEEIQDTDNLIIKGNNLFALHSLKKRFAGKVKLIYIDPPYNTGNDGFKYNDSFNHSTWLTFMKNRLEVSKELLAKDGTIAVSIDNKEQSYLHVLLDEIFGIDNKKNLITVKRSSVSGAKVINNGVVNVSEYIVIYSENTNYWNPNKIFRAKERDQRYNKFIINKDENYKNWKYITVLEAFAEYKNLKKSQLKKILGNEYEYELNNFIFNNSEKVIRFAALDDKAISKAVRDIKVISKKDNSKTYRIKRENFSDYYLFQGEAILFFEDRLIEIEGKKVFGELITDIWDDVLPNDLHNEGGVSFKKGKKPEKLLQRLIELFTNENEIILDYHLGSGTTAAVANKLNRQYIGIEQLDYGDNDSLVRLQNVIGGEGAGISRTVNWQGGGSFIYMELYELNKRFDREITDCKSKEEALKIFEDMLQNAILDYSFNLSKVEEVKEFIHESELSDIKKLLLSLLDPNHMYLNFSEIEDETYQISQNDKKINNSFYKVN